MDQRQVDVEAEMQEEDQAQLAPQPDKGARAKWSLRIREKMRVRHAFPPVYWWEAQRHEVDGLAGRQVAKQLGFLHLAPFVQAG
jgi:hypothetical protein